MSLVRTILHRIFAHPLTRDIHLDDPQTTVLRSQIIAQKPFLRRIYQEWYSLLAATIPTGPGRVLELGSGSGFFKEQLPEAIASDVFVCPHIDCVLDGQCIAMPDAALRAIVMTNVLHHIPQARKFFTEAARVVRPGGVVTMIEPWVSWWSRIVYTHLHHEPFLPDAAAWEFETTGPLSGANDALPWNIFSRDKSIFQREFSQWTIETVRPMMPFRYAISGGISMRSIVPGFAFPCVTAAESLLGSHMAMFAHIVLRRQ